MLGGFHFVKNGHLRKVPGKSAQPASRLPDLDPIAIPWRFGKNGGVAHFLFDMFFCVLHFFFILFYGTAQLSGVAQCGFALQDKCRSDVRVHGCDVRVLIYSRRLNWSPFWKPGAGPRMWPRMWSPRMWCPNLLTEQPRQARQNFQGKFAKKSRSLVKNQRRETLRGAGSMRDRFRIKFWVDSHVFSP